MFNTSTQYPWLVWGLPCLLLLPVLAMAAKSASTPSVAFNPPPIAPRSKKNCVLIVGAGTIGCSFLAVYLARGMEVVSVDPMVSRKTTEKRIREYWPNLVACGLTKAKSPPFQTLTKAESIQEAVAQHQPINFVQECSWEDVDHKRAVLAKLDTLVDPSILIASSTSFITWQLLLSECKHKHRIMIGHPAIPHTHLYMEIYGCIPKWVNYCKEWYAAATFDVLVMNKTILGHVFNSFFRVNLDHGQDLVQQGVCSVDDVNQAMRNFGQDVYGRHMFVSLLCGIGGNHGVERRKAIGMQIQDNAAFLTIFSALKDKGCPDFVAQPLGKYLGQMVLKLFPQAPEEYILAAEEFERKVTNNGQVPPQTALFNANSNIYKLIPLEVHKDPFGELQSKK